MKYLLVIAVVLGVLWLVRARSTQGKPPSASPKSSKDRQPADPQPMVSCAQCGVHLPRSEAVAGAQGLYCSDAHRRARGDAG